MFKFINVGHVTPTMSGYTVCICYSLLTTMDPKYCIRRKFSWVIIHLEVCKLLFSLQINETSSNFFTLFVVLALSELYQTVTP